MSVGTRRTIRIPAELDRVVEVRALVRDVAERCEADEPCIDDLVQAVDEAATNIIVHGYRRGPGWLEVTAERIGDQIVITLEDEAPVMDPTLVPEPDLSIPPQHRRPGGMGVHLMRKATNRLDHRARPGGGNILTMERQLDPRPKKER
jgi:anti-sigma regulatory factor (Ser/Thr protein kinase)